MAARKVEHLDPAQADGFVCSWPRCYSGASPEWVVTDPSDRDVAAYLCAEHEDKADDVDLE